MINRRNWIRRALIVGTVGLSSEQLWRHGHTYVFPNRFLVVEPGKIYRGAWQRSWPMRRIVRDHKIKCILALAHPAEHDLVVQERKLAGELKVKWIHIPIVDYRGTKDEVSEEAISDLLDQAAGVLADPENYPLFFHCHHGMNRTSMVQIAYRTRYCGWTLGEAADEIERTVGLVKVAHGPDYRHMVAYYDGRVLPDRIRKAEMAHKLGSSASAQLDSAPNSSSIRK
jgi:protein-tyrosine phosphatase